MKTEKMEKKEAQEETCIDLEVATRVHERLGSSSNNGKQ